MTSVPKTNIKKCTNSFLNDMIIIKYLDPNNIKIYEETYKKNLIYYPGYRTPNSKKPLYLIINNANEYINESKENKYLTLVTTEESKDKLNEYENIKAKIKDLRFVFPENNKNYSQTSLDECLYKLAG